MNRSTQTEAVFMPLAISVAVALVLLVLVVLPAEFGRDYTGFGRLTGLMSLSDEQMETANYNETAIGEIASDTQVWELLPYENLEYKYHLEEGQSLIFDWSSTGLVEYDFHTDAMIDGEEVSDSFMVSSDRNARGSYVAPYAGIHGIYFENRGRDPVTITLTTFGFYNKAILFRDGGEFSETFTGEGNP
jgi:hypothetical protein